MEVAGTEDDVVNWHHGNGLWELARDPYEPLWIKGGGHCNLELYPDFIRHLCRFVLEMENITTKSQLEKIRQNNLKQSKRTSGLLSQPVVSVVALPPRQAVSVVALPLVVSLLWIQVPVAQMSKLLLETQMHKLIPTAVTAKFMVTASEEGSCMEQGAVFRLVTANFCWLLGDAVVD
ncbi:hypothetical protein ACLOJK_028295 [Asimina triloba]